MTDNEITELSAEIEKLRRALEDLRSENHAKEYDTNHVEFVSQIRRKRSKKRFIGAYVYVWFDGLIPLYVGMSGRESRHNNNNHNSQAEYLRRNAFDFNCRTYDGLTEKGALFLEAALISLLQPMGNKVSGSRQYRNLNDEFYVYPSSVGRA